MKHKSGKGPARLDRSGQLKDQDAEYLEFQLDKATRQKVEALARASGCTPFELCVMLLRERISDGQSLSGAGWTPR